MTSRKESTKVASATWTSWRRLPHSPVGEHDSGVRRARSWRRHDASVDGACWRSSGARPRRVGDVHGADGRWVPTMPFRDGLRTLLRSPHRPHVGETCCAGRTRLNSGSRVALRLADEGSPLYRVLRRTDD